MIRQHQLSICQSRLIVGLELSQERRARHLGYRERGTCGAVVSIRLRSGVRPNEGRRRRGSMSLSITEKGSGGVYDGGEKYSRAATMTLLSLVARGGLMYSRAICFVLGIPCAIPPSTYQSWPPTRDIRLIKKTRVVGIGMLSLSTTIWAASYPGP